MLFLLLAPAHAICGAYVGPPGTTLQNTAANIILGRHAGRTTLTIAPDVTGDTASFALVIPVPEALEADDVSIASATLFAELDAATAPQVFSYTCDDVHGRDSGSSDSAGAGPRGSDGVTVESTFELGSYDLVVVSASGADGLMAWLDGHGFALSAALEPLLQEYIDAGQFFLAARVDLANLPSGGQLEPLRLGYDSDNFALPIRLGTAVSPGVQDLIVYVLASSRAAIANYPEGTVESGCMIPASFGADHDAFYASTLAGSFGPDSIWLTEFSANLLGLGYYYYYTQLDFDALIAAGSPDPWSDDAHVTRLRLRYAPEQAHQDLALYETTPDWTDLSYVGYDAALESDYPICGQGWAPNPGSCFDVVSADEGCGCSSPTQHGGLGLLTLAAAAVGKRRRRRGR